MSVLVVLSYLFGELILLGAVSHYDLVGAAPLLRGYGGHEHRPQLHGELHAPQVLPTCDE